jgi:ABC-type amino acid transport substrate-binding protein
MSFGVGRAVFGVGAIAMLAFAAGSGCRHPSPTTLVRPPAVLRVATSGDYAPFSSTSEGTRRGLDVEVAARLASDLDRRIEFVPVAWPDLTAAAFDAAPSTLRWAA